MTGKCYNVSWIKLNTMNFRRKKYISEVNISCIFFVIYIQTQKLIINRLSKFCRLPALVHMSLGLYLTFLLSESQTVTHEFAHQSGRSKSSALLNRLESPHNYSAKIAVSADVWCTTNTKSCNKSIRRVQQIIARREDITPSLSLVHWTEATSCRQTEEEKQSRDRVRGDM